MKRKFVLTAFIALSLLAPFALAGNYSIGTTGYKVNHRGQKVVPINVPTVTTEVVETTYEEVIVPKKFEEAKRPQASTPPPSKPHKAGEGYLDYNVSNPTIPDAFKDVVK